MSSCLHCWGVERRCNKGKWFYYQLAITTFGAWWLIAFYLFLSVLKPRRGRKYICVHIHCLVPYVYGGQGVEASCRAVIVIVNKGPHMEHLNKNITHTYCWWMLKSINLGRYNRLPECFKKSQNKPETTSSQPPCFYFESPVTTKVILQSSSEQDLMQLGTVALVLLWRSALSLRVTHTEPAAGGERVLLCSNSQRLQSRTRSTSSSWSQGSHVPPFTQCLLIFGWLFSFLLRL